MPSSANGRRLTLATTTLTLCVVICAAFAVAAQEPSTSAGAQAPASEDPTVTIVIDKRQRPKIHLAHPALELERGASSALEEAARILDDALRHDLEASGIFVIQGPSELAVAELIGDPQRDFEIYRSLGNELLLKTLVRAHGDQMVLEGRLYDLASGRAVLGKRYTGGLDLARRIAHTFADEIILYITGRRGVSLTSIAFYSDRTGHREIFLMDYDGFNPRRITGHQTISLSPDWARGDEEIAYVSFLHGPPGIFLVDLISGEKRTLIDDGHHNLSPSMSPDAQQFAFARSLAGNWEIFIANRDGGNLRRVTHSSAIDTNPAWSPNGRTLAFTSSRSGTPQVYLIDMSGANLRRVSRQGTYNDGAAWHPDGAMLAYASRRDGQFQIVLADLVTGEEQVLTSGPGSSEAPTFAPNGRKIAFARTVHGSGGRQTQIWMMEADGSRETQLTSQGNNFGPSWSGWRE